MMRVHNSHPPIPQVAIIVAMTEQGVIGVQNGLPWQIPEELKLFKKLTTGNTVIMGHKTYKSIGKLLPQRNNIILSRRDLSIPGATVCKRFIDALIAAVDLNKPVYVIGGREIYTRALPLASELHISWIKKQFSGEIFFPEFDQTEWDVIEDVDYNDFTYRRYLRKSQDVSQKKPSP